jgi:hypothetical protein
LEAVEGKPLRIAGVAMTAGMSRNHNVYTPEELQAFAPKLIGSPLYLEHVTVESAIGKVTNCIFEAPTKSLLYEAEIYDPTISEKIRNGLIQHVSVGADYDTLDSANVPHGLHNAEMSLVAVPGIPETNTQVLESLRNGVEGLEEKDIESIVEKVAAKIGEKKSLEIEGLKTKLSEAEGKLVAAEAELAEKKNRLTEAVGKLATTENKLGEANRTTEKLKALVSGVDLLVNPPKLMPVSEALDLVNSVVPSRMVQRSWGLGPQRMCQELARVTQALERRLK